MNHTAVCRTGPATTNLLSIHIMYDMSVLKSKLNYKDETIKNLAVPKIKHINFFFSEIPQPLEKLYGAGPVDNKPSTNKLHHFIQFC